MHLEIIICVVVLLAHFHACASQGEKSFEKDDPFLKPRDARNVLLGKRGFFGQIRKFHETVREVARQCQVQCWSGWGAWSACSPASVIEGCSPRSRTLRDTGPQGEKSFEKDDPFLEPSDARNMLLGKRGFIGEIPKFHEVIQENARKPCIRQNGISTRTRSVRGQCKKVHCPGHHTTIRPCKTC